MLIKIHNLDLPPPPPRDAISSSSSSSPPPLLPPFFFTLLVLISLAVPPPLLLLPLPAAARFRRSSFPPPNSSSAAADADVDEALELDDVAPLAANAAAFLKSLALSLEFSLTVSEILGAKAVCVEWRGEMSFELKYEKLRTEEAENADQC